MAQLPTRSVHAFDSDLQHANAWLKTVSHRLATDDPALAKHALRGVLHALRDRLGTENAAHLAAQLPTLIRGIFYEGWRPADRSHERHSSDFLSHVGAGMGRGAVIDVGAAVDAVLHTLWNHIDPGEVAKIKAMLPPDLAALWPDRPDSLDVALSPARRSR